MTSIARKPTSATATATAGTGEPDGGKVVVPVTAKLLIDDAETAALLGLSVGSIANLESRDPTFPRPVDWVLDRKVRRRVDVEGYVDQLRLRRA